MGILGFKSKRDEVLEHWISFADGFNQPSQEFYALIKKELDARKIPSMEMSDVEYAEGGLLSDRRLYLRMMRERLAFDLCAAPFGNTYFFSCRTVHSPPVLRLWHLAVAGAFFWGLSALFLNMLGLWFAVIAMVTLILAIAEVFRNAVAMGLNDLDNALMKIPILSPIYENWFRKDTYYRQDARLAYLAIIPAIVKKAAEDVTGAKGIKLTRRYERTPVLGELYKPVPQQG
jgi:hypothetical protein